MEMKVKSLARPKRFSVQATSKKSLSFYNYTNFTEISVLVFILQYHPELYLELQLCYVEASTMENILI